MFFKGASFQMASRGRPIWFHLDPSLIEVYTKTALQPLL